MSGTASLRAIKLLHTAVWAFFVSCILYAPFAAQRGHLGVAAILLALVAVESVVLALNRWTCPLTPIAARHTTDRAPNFDIYLPLWLARYNKEIFAPLYLLSIAYTLCLWWWPPPPQ